MRRVVVRDADTREVLWEHPVTGRPFVNYVPMWAWNRKDAGLVTIIIEEQL